MAEHEPRTPILDIRNVVRRFGGITAANDVSLQVREGELLGLIGPNGAGKTTLFHIVAGATSPDAGDVLFKGERILKLRPDQRSALGIARTFQVPQPFSGMTVRDNMEVAIRFRRRGQGREPMPSAGQLMHEFGLSPWAESDAASIPLGAKKRLEFARAVASGPQLLLLDEVMGGLRPNEIDDLMRVIRKIHRSGVTIIMIEHVMRAVMSLAERIAVLHHGELIATGSPSDIAADRTVIDAYLGTPHHAKA